MRDLTQALQQVLNGKSLTSLEAEQAMGWLIEGQSTIEQAAGFLIALRAKSESVEEISGFVDCLRKKSIRVLPSRLGADEAWIDVCGTGGDGAGTFNVSSTVAFVLAAAGQPIAKHGNRSVSGRTGSFDVVEALGLKFETDPLIASALLEKHNLGLLFAPAFHPSLKSMASLRKNLGVYTVFNALGPLLNPAQVKRQLIGVYSLSLLEKVPEVLRRLGSIEAMVVHGDDGLDEISLCAPTQVAHLKDGEIKRYQVSPEDFGFARASATELQGGDARRNAEIILEILSGQPGPKRDVTLMNAAAALVVSGKAKDFKSGVQIAKTAIDSGRARKLVEEMKS